MKALEVIMATKARLNLRSNMEKTVKELVYTHNEENKLHYDDIIKSHNFVFKLFVPFTATKSFYVNESITYNEIYVRNMVEELKLFLLDKHILFTDVIEKESDKGIFLAFKFNKNFGSKARKYHLHTTHWANLAKEKGELYSLEDIEKDYSKEYFYAKTHYHTLDDIYSKIVNDIQFKDIIRQSETNLKVRSRPTPNLDTWQ